MMYNYHIFKGFFQKNYFGNFMAISLMKNYQNSFKNFFQQAISQDIFVRFWKTLYRYDQGSEIFYLITQNYRFKIMSLGTWIRYIHSPIIMFPSFLKSDKNCPRNGLLKKVFNEFWSFSISDMVIKLTF